MAQHEGLYQRAMYYDIALERDVDTEVAFLMECYTALAGKRPQSVMDIACGPGYHARALAHRGLRVVGVDLYREMLELAAARAKSEDLEVDWRVGDMRDFSLDAPVDFAICMFDGIDALLTNDDVVRHLQAVARNLTAGGFYLIDCTHPRDCSYSDYGTYRYGGQRDGISVDVLWATNQPAIDPITGIAEVALELHVRENGTSHVIRDIARERCYTAPELALLVETSGVFRINRWYGRMDVDQPLDATAESTRMIALLEKT